MLPWADMQCFLYLYCGHPTLLHATDATIFNEIYRKIIKILTLTRSSGHVKWQLYFWILTANLSFAIPQYFKSDSLTCKFKNIRVLWKSFSSKKWNEYSWTVLNIFFFFFSIGNQDIDVEMRMSIFSFYSSTYR